MPTLQPAELWRESGRYDDYGKEMLRIRDRHERDMLYGPTNEELITDIFRNSIKSYRDLPKNLYHIQWKFRDEVRPRFGVMRGREFLMKDAYSFDLDKAGAIASYFRMFVAYMKTFKRMGLKAIPMRADTGPIGGDLSHEFHVLADTGESELFYDSDDRRISTRTSIDPISTRRAELHPPLVRRDRREARRGRVRGARARGAPPRRRAASRSARSSISARNIRSRWAPSSPGPTARRSRSRWAPTASASRAWSARIIEASHDDAGIIWPERGGAVRGRPDQSARRAMRNAAPPATSFTRKLQHAGIEALYDDRDESAGAKFAAMDLIGLPWQLVVGPRGLANDVVEVKNRKTGERQELSAEAALDLLAAALMIFGPLERMVAFRYLRARRQEGFISVIAIFSLTGIALGRRDPDRHHGGDERLPRRAAGPHPRLQRPYQRLCGARLAHRLRRPRGSRSRSCPASSRRRRRSRAR